MASSQLDIDAALRPRITRLVPAIFLSDGSSFANAAQSYLRRAVDKEFRRVVLYGSAADAPAAARPLSAPGFFQAIAPLTLMGNVPAWCVWFVDASSTAAHEFLSQVQALTGSTQTSFHHVVFVRLHEREQADDWAADPITRMCVPFVLMTRSPSAERTEQQLARGASAYAYSAWRDYWRSGDTNLAAALALPDTKVVTLGIAACELDVPHHSRRWAGKLVHDLFCRFLRPRSHTLEAKFATAADLLSHLLPDWYVATSKQEAARTIDVVTTESRTQVHYIERERRPEVGSLSHRRHFTHLLTQLRQRFAFLEHVVAPNTRQFVQCKEDGLGELIWGPARRTMTLPDSPDGLLPYIAHCAQACAEYADATREIRVDGLGPGSSFEQDYTLAWRRISAIPNIAGAIARLVLICLGLAGLIITPVWWGGVHNPLSDAVVRYVAIGAGVLFLACCAGIPLDYFYSCRLADHRMDMAEENMVLRHLRQICGLAISPIRAQADALHKALTALDLRLRSLSDHAKASVSTQLIAPPVGRGWIPDSAVDALLQPRTTEMASAAFSSARDRLDASRGIDGLPQFTPEFWNTVLSDSAETISRDAIEDLSFDECVATMSPRPSKRAELISSLAQEARKPAWPTRGDPTAALICFGEPTQWQDHTGQYDTMQFRSLRLKDMVMVSVIPLREFSRR